MRLTVVGCSGSYPGPDSPASCYLVEAEGPDAAGGTRTWRILLDLGSGALGALHRYADPLTVDAVFLSDLHPDHCLDLTGFYVVQRYHPDGRQPRVPVWGPVGTADRMARAYDLPLDPGMHQEFEFRTYDGPAELGPFVVEPVAVDHPGPAFGFRVTATAARWATPVTPAPAPDWTRSPRVRTSCWPRHRSPSAGSTRPGCTSPAPSAARRRPAAARVAWSYPRPGVGRPARGARRGALGVRRRHRGRPLRGRLRGLTRLRDRLGPSVMLGP